MGLQSLRDKLLQAGLVTEDQAKKAEADIEARKRSDRRPAGGQGTAPAKGKGGPQGGPRGARPARPQGNRAQQPQAHAKQPPQPRRELTAEEKLRREEEAAFRERERLLNKEREENRKRAQEDRKRLETLRALCEAHEVTERGDEAFHFTSRKKRVMRIYLTPAQLVALEKGDLAIIDKPTPGELTTALVTRAAAEEAVKLDARTVRFFNPGTGETFGFKAEAPLPGEEAATESEAHEEPAESAADATGPTADANHQASEEPPAA